MILLLIVTDWSIMIVQHKCLLFVKDQELLKIQGHGSSKEFTDRNFLVRIGPSDFGSISEIRVREMSNRNEGNAWTYDQQETCNHWIDCRDGRSTMVDQEMVIIRNSRTSQLGYLGRIMKNQRIN